MPILDDQDRSAARPEALSGQLEGDSAGLWGSKRECPHGCASHNCPRTTDQPPPRGLRHQRQEQIMLPPLSKLIAQEFLNPNARSQEVSSSSGMDCLMGIRQAVILVIHIYAGSCPGRSGYSGSPRCMPHSRIDKKPRIAQGYIEIPIGPKTMRPLWFP